MTANDLAEIIKGAQRQGAPEWGVTLIVQQHELRAAFLRHCEDEEGRRAPWKRIVEKIVELAMIALVWWVLTQAPAILAVGP